MPYILTYDYCSAFRLAAVARRTCIAAQAAALHFPTDKARLTNRRQAAITFALQNADRVVHLGSLTAVEDNLPSLFSAGVLLGFQLAAFQNLAELKLDFPVSNYVLSLLPRSLRRQDLQIQCSR